MGVLGWAYEQTLDTPMPAIERALQSRHKLISDVLKFFAGPPDEPETPAEPGALMSSLRALAEHRQSKDLLNG